MTPARRTQHSNQDKSEDNRTMTKNNQTLTTDNTVLSVEPQPQIAQLILSDPSTSFWMKRALESALARDPVDAARDASELAHVLQSRSFSAMGEALQAIAGPQPSAGSEPLRHS